MIFEKRNFLITFNWTLSHNFIFTNFKIVVKKSKKKIKTNIVYVSSRLKKIDKFKNTIKIHTYLAKKNICKRQQFNDYSFVS